MHLYEMGIHWSFISLYIHYNKFNVYYGMPLVLRHLII